MEYRRTPMPGGRFFFTVVAYNREKLFAGDANIEVLRCAIRDVMQRHSFSIDAFVVLPDRLHCIWTLPPGDHDFFNPLTIDKKFF